MFLSFLNALPVSSSTLLSAWMQISLTEAPALHKATVSFKTPVIKKRKMVAYVDCYGFGYLFISLTYGLLFQPPFCIW